MQFPGTAHNPWPFTPPGRAAMAPLPAAARAPLSHRLANLLLTDPVQRASFTVGHVIVLPEKFRAVSDALRSGRMKIVVDPVRLASEEALAMYLPFESWGHKDTFLFATDSILDTEAGRVTAVHEALHASMDSAGQQTAVRNEEGAAYVMECIYAKYSGIKALANTTQAIMDVAKDIWTRMDAGERPAKASAAQIAVLRREMADSFNYRNDFYYHDWV